MRVRGLLVTALLGAGLVYMWLERPHEEWLGRGQSDSRPGDGDSSSPPSGIPGTDGSRPDAGTHFAPTAPPSGEPLEVVLLQTPAPRYADPPSEGVNDAAYRELLAEVAREVGMRPLYDLDLARAAREVAYYTGVQGHVPPEVALTFLLHASGAPERSAAQFFTHSTSDAPDVVRATLTRALENARDDRRPGVLRVGIGEVDTPNQAYSRHVGVLLTRRAYQIDPTPRTAALGGSWRLTGRLPVGYRDPSVSVLYPDGRMESAELELSGSSFAVRVPTGDTPGTAYVSIDGTDTQGPGKLLQLSFAIGEEGAPAPDRASLFVPPRDDFFTSIDEAERYAFGLLQSDRARFSLATLELDPELTAIARAHSEDMRDNGFFGHLSPTTGLAGDRLRRAGYRAIMHSENLARNDSIAEAEAALLASVGHRKNLLDHKPTHVGVGVAMLVVEDRTEWFVTQMFARPVVELDHEAMHARLLQRIERQRERQDLPPLRESERMSDVAREHAQEVAAGELEGVARKALDQLSDMNLTMRASVHAIYDPDSFELPAAALDPDATRIGLGVRQSRDDSHGRTGIVLILGLGQE